MWIHQGVIYKIIDFFEGRSFAKIQITIFEQHHRWILQYSVSRFSVIELCVFSNSLWRVLSIKTIYRVFPSEMQYVASCLYDQLYLKLSDLNGISFAYWDEQFLKGKFFSLPMPRTAKPDMFVFQKTLVVLNFWCATN